MTFHQVVLEFSILTPCFFVMRSYKRSLVDSPLSEGEKSGGGATPGRLPENRHSAPPSEASSSRVGVGILDLVFAGSTPTTVSSVDDRGGGSLFASSLFNPATTAEAIRNLRGGGVRSAVAEGAMLVVPPCAAGRSPEAEAAVAPVGGSGSGGAVSAPPRALAVRPHAAACPPSPPPMPSASTPPSAEVPCAICQLDLTETPSDEPVAPGFTPALLEMPCCRAWVHVHCAYSLCSLRAIRKNCCACQQEISEEADAMVKSARASSKLDEAARVRALELALRGLERE